MITRYDVITKLVSKWARGINEQLQKSSGADVLSSRKKNQKNLRQEGQGEGEVERVCHADEI